MTKKEGKTPEARRIELKVKEEGDLGQSIASS